MWQVLYKAGGCDWVTEDYVRFVSAGKAEEAIKSHQDIRLQTLTFHWYEPKSKEESDG